MSDPVIRQESTGGLYGYTDKEMTPHAAAWHGKGFMTEEDHLDDHAKGQHHEHYRAETGALSLAIRSNAIELMPRRRSEG